MSYTVSLSRLMLVLAGLSAPLAAPRTAGAQQSTAADPIERMEMVAGRSLPLTNLAAISKVTVADPKVADVVVITERDVVVNSLQAGETDIILWSNTAPRRHLRVIVRPSPERRQILLAVKFAEVRRDALRRIGTSLLYRATNGNTRAGTNTLNTDANITNNAVTIPSSAMFGTVLSTFNTKDLVGLLEAEEQLGNARFLAEPNIMAANRDTATFLAGGKLPVPVIQGGGGGQTSNAPVTIQYQEFGIKLKFVGEVLTDSLLKLQVRPEVSSLDYGNAITLQGFRIPALRSREVNTTVDVLQDRSLIISGLFNEERERVKTGLPLLVNIPILGELFSSQRWVKNESELIVVVTPVLMDPNNPRAADLLRLQPDSTLPARGALEKRLPPVKK